MERIGHWIGGKLVLGESGRRGPVFNPATGEVARGLENIEFATGISHSLFGDSHMCGRDGIHFCTTQKVVTARWPDPGTSAVDLVFPRTR